MMSLSISNWQQLKARTAFAFCLPLVAGLLSVPSIVQGKEPYERFLNELKQRRLFDLALVYLDSQAAKAGNDAKFRANLELERGLLQYQSAAVLPTSNSNRSTQLDEAEQSLRKFLDKQPRHPRRGEARLKIGELLLQRAEEAKSAQKAPDSSGDNPEAIKYYDEAHKLFESTIAELAKVLEGIKGARTDSKDKEAVAYRLKVQQDLRQAQLLSAKSVEERGRSRAKGSKQYKADLQQALKMFSDLYSKEQRMVGVRNYALFYRSAIQATLGLNVDAIDGYESVADLEGVDVLRPLQSNAIKELLGLYAAAKKYPLAVDRADTWIAGLRPAEKSSPETMDLKLELAKTKIAWSKKLKRDDPDDRVASRLLRDTRSELTSMLRVKGGHLDETRKLLSELGVDRNEKSDSDGIPEVKSFDDAIAAAQERIDDAEAASLNVTLLREQGKDAQAQKAEAEMSRWRQEAIQLIRTGLSMYSPDNGLEALEQGRYSLAFLLLKEQEAEGAYAVAEFLSIKNPKSDRGLNAAGIALFAMSDMIRTAGEDKIKQLTDRLEPFASYLVATWPDSEEAASAASVLVQLSIGNQQWEKLDAYLALAPKQGKAAKRLRRSAGIAFFNRIEAAKKAGEPAQEIAKLKARALESLEIATNGIDIDSIDSGTIDAINALARLYLNDGQIEKASKLILNLKTSPLRALKKRPEIASTNVAMNTYRTAIQLTISQLAAGTINNGEAIRKTQEYITELQKIAANDAEGPKRLSGIFVALAKDLKIQVSEATTDDQRKRLSEAMVILAKEAANSEDFNTKYWAADTIVSIAEEVGKGAKGRQIAMKAFGDALQILQKILNEDAAQPGFIQPEAAKTQIRLLMAKASRGIGDYKTAVGQLADILKANGGLLDVQIEAARAYQGWGDSSNAGFHRFAFLGGRKDPKTQKNVIWGWGKIARAVEGNEQYEQQFYLARYELARSRYKYAQSLKNNEDKTAELKRAEKDIVATATLYPKLGGNEQKKKYDSLLKVIQKALGKKQAGLSGLTT